MSLIDLSPATVAERLRNGKIILIDVREAHENAAERIPGAILMPLSSFDPAAIPQERGKAVVLHCARGGRSAQAVQRCRHAGLKIDSHLAGGIAAWKSAGLPTESAPRDETAGVFSRMVNRFLGK